MSYVLFVSVGPSNFGYVTVSFSTMIRHSLTVEMFEINLCIANLFHNAIL